jgi:hypothetical protein
LHDFRHRIHPDFLEGRCLLRSLFKVVAHRFNPQPAASARCERFRRSI